MRTSVARHAGAVSRVVLCYVSFPKSRESEPPLESQARSINVGLTAARVHSKTHGTLILRCVAEQESHVRFRVEVDRFRESQAILEVLEPLT